MLFAFVLFLVLIAVPNQSLAEKYAELIVTQDAEGSFPQIPLKNVKVDAQIVDFLAKVVVTQTYENDQKVPLECIYRFPLEEKSGNCHPIHSS